MFQFFDNQQTMQWLVWILFIGTVSTTSGQLDNEGRSWNDYENFLAEHIPARVVQHTPVSRMRRSFMSDDGTTSFSQDMARYAHWFDFPEKMMFSIVTTEHYLVLNLTRNDLAMQNAYEGNDYASRLGVYDSVKQGASVLIECEDTTCVLHGVIEIDGIQYHIQQDESTENYEDHSIRRRALPNLKELMESLYVVGEKIELQEVREKRDARENREIHDEPSNFGSNVRIRRSSIPTECDIIEVKALADNTIWNYYKDRYNGDEQKATDEIYKYFRSIYAEADFRLRCLTDYFTHYEGTCVVKCLRVILVDIEITKSSSFTTGKFHSAGFVKGPDALSVCGTINENMANSVNGWHNLHCFTRENIGVQEGSTWYDKYRTLVKYKKICTSSRRDRVAIHEFRGDGVSIQIAHGLLRFLGAKRDKDNWCSKNGWFLMRIPQFQKTHNPGFWGQSWYLSDCTVKDICDYVNGLNPNCMRVRGNLVNETIWHAWEDTPLPGEVLSIDEQCKVRWGNESVQCDPTGQGNFYPEDMCGNHIYCTSSQYTGCVCKVRVESGTPCGHARVCKKGQCMFNKDVPLGKKCECHSQCISNAVCDPDIKVCVCKEGFYNNSGNCTEQLPNGSPCTDDDECKDPNAECINGICQCKPCYYNNSGTCEKQSDIGEECNTTAQCKGDQTVCDNNICVCKPGFFIDDEANCVPVNGTICDRCIQNPDSCTQDGTTCSDRGFCECSNNTVEVKGECYGTKVGESCTIVVDTCTDNYAVCNGTVCDCVDGFHWNGTKCVGQKLCDPCDTSPSSCDPELVCSPETYRCECPNGQVQIGDNCYGRFVTEPCTNSLDTCIDDNAECNGTVCDCIANFVWNGSICSGDNLCDPCDPALSTCVHPLECSANTYRCECPPGFVQIGDNCYGTRVGQPCTTSQDTCIDDNAVCNGTICVCVANWVWNGSICLGPDLCDPCSATTASCGSGLRCNPNTNRCECQADEVQYVDDCYGTLIGDPCTTSLDTCIDDNALCNGSVCDCKPGFTYNGTFCVGTDLCDRCDPASLTCTSPLVCSSDTYRCECQTGFVQIGNSCYGRLVSEPCTSSLDTCIDDYAECNGTVCNCIPGFHWNGSSCVGERLCEPCDPANPTCSNDLICSTDSYRCECPPDQVQIADDCYGARVGEPCTTTLDTCIDDFAVCNDTVCNCIENYVWNGTNCNGPNLCDPCDATDSTCDSNLYCNPATSRCECPVGQVQISAACYGRLVTEPCTPTTDTCIDDNAICNGSVCDCKTGFTFNGTICVGTELCEPCDLTPDTCKNGLVCSSDTYRCECPSDQVQIGDACYGRLVGEVCTCSLDTCIDDYAVCNCTVCVCEPGFHWNGTNCGGENLCDPCDPANSFCSNPLQCSSTTYRCECPPGFVQIGDNCYGTIVGEPCLDSLDTCIDDNAGCNGTICDCNDGFVWNGTICVGTTICSPCDTSNPCDTGLQCNPSSNRCECPDDRVQVGDICYGTRVTEPCTSTVDTCIDCNAECNATVCDCVTGFTWNGTLCVGGELCDPCDLTLSCNTGLVCDPSRYRCECQTGFVQIGNSCYGTQVSEPCTTSLDTCTNDFAECNGTVCDCISGYTWNGSRCVGQGLCDPCDPAQSTCDTGLTCNTITYRCECLNDEVQIGDNCYGTDIGDDCTLLLDTCKDDNAECNGTICDCVTNWVWNGSICVGPNLCDPCDPSTQSCDDDLECSSSTYRCECPSGHVQIGDNCYGTRVGEPCLPSTDTCIDDNAGCNGTICVCDENHKWNGSICVGPNLCSQCDPNIQSCGSGLVCNSATYRCECPQDEVQYGDNCYGTNVGDPCTTSFDTCIDDNAICNGSVCDCLPGFTYNGSICVGSDLCDPCDPTDSTCTSPLVCSSDTYRCECQTDYVQYDGSCYGRLVSEPCTLSLNTCINDNAICNGSVCICLDGWVFNGTSCGGPDLCDPCDPLTASCDSSLTCNPNTYRCECEPGKVQVGDRCVGTLVTEPCTPVLNTCIDDYAECNGTVCDCVAGFVYNGSRCLGSELCEPCDPGTATCSSPLQCSNDTYRCECPPDKVQIRDRCVGTRVEEECVTVTDTCIDDNALCNDTFCVCKPGFTWTGSLCVASNINDPCSPTNPCSGNLVCNVNTSKCACPPTLVQIGELCFGTLIGEVCTTILPTCIDDFAECNGTVCDCKPGYQYNGTLCVGSELCDPCDPEDSTCGTNLVCSSDTYRCQCKPDEVQVGDNCYGTHVGDDCTTSPDTCIDDKAACNGTVCDCISGYSWNGTNCHGTGLCDSCDPTSSTCDPSLRCNVNTYRCECQLDEVQIGDVCYGTRVGERCTNIVNTCIDDFAVCNGTFCVCASGTTWNGTKCVGSDLCDPCDGNSCTSPLVCGSSSRCECPSDKVQIGNQCYGTLVTEECTQTLNTCVDSFAECNGTVCDCKAGYHWNGSRCNGENLCDPCDPSASTCRTGLRCSPDTYRCECETNQVQVSDMCYGTRVTEPCTASPDTCIDDFAICNGTICDCKQGFVWNGSLCLGRQLCEPCNPSGSTCEGSLVCSSNNNRCECPTGFVQIQSACYGRSIGESCTPALDTCIDDNAQCNGTVCDCQTGFHYNGSICVGTELCDPCDSSVVSCSGDLECSSSTDRCECPSGKVQIGNNCYGTRVGDDCTTSHDTCIDDYAECNGTVCNCVAGFSWNGTRCVGTNLCEPCDPTSSTCDTNLQCSATTYRCECQDGFVQISDMCYGRHVAEPCTPSLDTCIDDNAGCNGTVCNCNAGFTWNGTICVGTDLCDPCDQSALPCAAPLVCSSTTYVCECPSNNVQIGNDCYGTRVTESCTPARDTCIDDFAACNRNVCACLGGYQWNGTRCVGGNLCDPCDPSNSTCSGLDCSTDTYRCTCPSGQVQIGDACYGRLVGDGCTTPDTCIQDNAACNGTICDCLPGFTYNGSICVGSQLCDPCDSSTLACASPLTCSSTTYRCECPAGSVQIDGACYGTLIGQPCTNSYDVCIDDNAGCNGTICTCLPGYFYNGSICVGTESCDPCDESTANCSHPLQCSSISYRCECPSTHVRVGETCVGTKVGEPCTATLDTCLDNYAACNGSICDCITGWKWNGTQCVGPNLCDPCDPTLSSCNAGLICSSTTYRCECQADEVQISGSCYGTRIGETCTPSVPTCIDDYAECNGTVCNCIQGFTYNGSICVGNSLCDPCDPATSSCASPLQCSSNTYTCECPAGFVQIGDACYGTHVGQDCTSSVNTCIDDYAECNGTVCVCIAGYIWNGSICGGPNLCDRCDPNTPSCGSGLTCSSTTYRCECPADQVQYSDKCYGRNVGDPCTTSLDTCIDDNAICNGTVCDCKPGFSYNGSLCSGSNLCDRCDPGSNTCSGSLVCSSTTYRCECPPGEVQIGNDCYGTNIGDSCTASLSTCIDDNAECQGSLCTCKQNYVWNGTFCLGPDLCSQCDPNTPSCQFGSVCNSATYRCECPPDRVQYGDDCYGRLIGEPCTTSLDTCIDDNAFCDAGTCECITSFTYNTTLDLCVGTDLDDPCDANSCGVGLSCGSTSQKCECSDPPVQIDNDCYGTRVGESCTTATNTCIDDNADCVSGICTCDTGFTWNGNICVGKELDEPCDNSAASCSANGLVCGPTYRCECPADQVQINNICLSLQCDSCDVDADCFGSNVVCFDDPALGKICKCDTNFYLDDCGVCQPKIANNGSCDSDDQCQSGICVCGVCQATDDHDCCNDCDEFIADVIFVTDNSGSVGNSNYQRLKAFVVALANAFTISSTETRIGVVDYSRFITSANTFNMNVYTSNLAFATQVIGHSYVGSFTRTDRALDRARDFLNSAANRAGVPNVVVVLTDGNTNDGGQSLLPAAANNLKNVLDTTVYAVGIGDGISLSELQLIATDNSTVYEATSFTTLDKITEDILTDICDSN